MFALTFILTSCLDSFAIDSFPLVFVIMLIFSSASVRSGADIDDHGMPDASRSVVISAYYLGTAHFIFYGC